MKKPGPKVVKLFSGLTEHEIYHAQIPTLVSILTFISMINTTCVSLKARKVFYQRFGFYQQLKFHAQLS